MNKKLRCQLGYRMSVKLWQLPAPGNRVITRARASPLLGPSHHPLITVNTTPTCLIYPPTCSQPVECFWVFICLFFDIFDSWTCSQHVNCYFSISLFFWGILYFWTLLSLLRAWAYVRNSIHDGFGKLCLSRLSSFLSSVFFSSLFETLSNTGKKGSS